MPTGDNSPKGVKTVQTMLAAKKTGNTSKENPPKREKKNLFIGGRRQCRRN